MDQRALDRVGPVIFIDAICATRSRVYQVEMRDLHRLGRRSSQVKLGQPDPRDAAGSRLAGGHPKGVGL
jgi:hypothetical protein